MENAARFSTLPGQAALGTHHQGLVAPFTYPEQRRPGHCGGHEQGVQAGYQQRQVGHPAKAQAAQAAGAQPGEHGTEVQLVVVGAP